MKKKAALIAIVVIVCSVLGVLAGSFQKKMLSGQAAGKNKITSSSGVSNEAKNDRSTSADKSQSASSSNTQPNAGQINKSSSDTSKSAKTTESSSNSGKSTAGSNAVAKTSGAPKTTAPVNNKSNSRMKSNGAASSAPANFYIINGITGQTIYSSRENLEGKNAGNVTKDVLRRQGISNSIDTMSGYVSMIGGLRERQNGALSGWCYYVNGQKPSMSASEYTLKADDKLVWKYLKDGINNN